MSRCGVNQARSLIQCHVWRQNDRHLTVHERVLCEDPFKFLAGHLLFHLQLDAAGRGNLFQQRLGNQPKLALRCLSKGIDKFGFDGDGQVRR